MSVTAYEVNRDFISQQPEGCCYRLLIENMSYYFFSHLHNLEITHLEFPVTVSHLVSFIEFYSWSYNGDDVGRAFEEFTVIFSSLSAGAGVVAQILGFVSWGGGWLKFLGFPLSASNSWVSP